MYIIVGIETHPTKPEVPEVFSVTDRTKGTKHEDFLAVSRKLYREQTKFTGIVHIYYLKKGGGDAVHLDTIKVATE